MIPRSWSRAVREALAPLSRAPGEDWRSRSIHHGTRLLLVVTVAVSIPALFPREPLPQFAHLEEGMVASEDMIAEMSFPVMKAPERLEAERAEAASGVAPIFTPEADAADAAVSNSGALFTALDSVTAATVEESEAAATDEADPDEIERELRAVVQETMSDFGVDISPSQAEYLLDEGRRNTLQRTTERAFRTLLPEGVASRADLSEISSGQVVIRGEERDRLIRRDSLLTSAWFYSEAAELTPGEITPTGRQLYQTLLVRFMQPSLRLDRDATRMAREQARQAVEATASYILEGERIVTAHERVGGEEMQKLRAYQSELSRLGLGGGGGLVRDLGAILYGIALLGLLGLTLCFFRPSLYRDMRGFSIIVGLSFITLVAASIIARTGAPPVLVPVAFAVLIVGILYDGMLALVTALTIAALMAGQPPFAGLSVFFLTLAGGSAAALGVRGVRRRSDSWILIAVITAGYLGGGLALTLMRSLPVGDLLAMTAWGGVNATLSTVVVVAVALPALEGLTGITTDQTLLELSDLNRPLLRRLSREAPGTYAHSINVANLAEAAASAIGANALLTRVGVYYHDIGKMHRPQFFIENQPKGRNPHDRIPPLRSAQVIREHVTAGVRMAEDARLPRILEDFIREHHGTSAISYFLDRALNERPEEEVDRSEFRYPGPRPRSKETAIVMLADGVESTTRALGDPTPESVREVIERIVRERLDAGELDESPLTLQDLKEIKTQFGRVLDGMYHRRIDYPDEEPAPGSEDGAGRGGTDGAGAPGSGDAPSSERDPAGLA